MKKSEFHRIATIDIGTNGIKFKQYRIDVNKKSKIQQDTFSRVNIRLGEDVFNYGLISENTQKKLFKELSKLIESVKKRNIKDEYFDKFNYERYGGSPIIGLNKAVVIGHGISNQLAIKNMVFLTKNIAEARLSEKIKKHIN